MFTKQIRFYNSSFLFITTFATKKSFAYMSIKKITYFTFLTLKVEILSFSYALPRLMTT